MHAGSNLQRIGISRAEVGFWLDGEEQRRRYLLQSLLHHEGLVLADYRARFGSSPLEDFAPLRALQEAGWARVELGRLTLSPERLECSDEIGPWLYSDAVLRLSGEYALR